MLYIHLVEKMILSCATLHKLREIRNTLRHGNQKLPGLIKEILFIKENMHAKDRYRRLFDLYFQRQTKINTLLTTSVNIFNYRSKLIDMEELILIASDGLSHVKKISSLELPLTTSCYIKLFNESMSEFLVSLEKNSQTLKILYNDYNNDELNEEEFYQAVSILKYRLQLTIGFIDHYLSEESFSKDDPKLKTQLPTHLSALFLELFKSMSMCGHAVSAILAK